jgi:hypothetical protein
MPLAGITALLMIPLSPAPPLRIGPGFRDSKQKDMIRVDADAIPGVRLGHPRELHDRSAGRREDRGFDLLRIPFDPQEPTSGERELSDRQRCPSPRSRRGVQRPAHAANSDTE